MNTNEFIKAASQIILGHMNEEDASVECVWYSYLFGNIKALFIIKYKSGSIGSNYYEATYRKETGDLWVQVYVKNKILKPNYATGKL